MITVKIGQKYNKLIILKDSFKSKGQKYVECKCDCGNIKVINMYHLFKGDTKSCGCLHKEKFNNKKLGMTGTSFRNIWASMKERCSNKNRKEYKYYGGRGITYDPKWEKFEGFYEDMYNKYIEHSKIYGERNTTIDRKDNDGNYNKKNCRWATYKKQARNRSNNINYKGKCLAEWCEILGIPRGKFERLRYIKKKTLKEIFLF